MTAAAPSGLGVRNRLGFGAMRIATRDASGLLPDRTRARRLLRRAVDLGVGLIDTAHSYSCGPNISEELIREALHPYREVVIATKGGLEWDGPGRWRPIGRPGFLRHCVETSLARLGVEALDLFQLHRIDPDVPLAEQLGALDELRTEGKVRRIGLCEVTVDDLVAARGLVEIASVQNLYHLADRRSENVLDLCDDLGLAFIAWYPLAAGRLTIRGGPLARPAADIGASPSQLALSWLLRRSAGLLPIPGTSSIAHLEENCAASGIELDDDHFHALSRLAAPVGGLA